MLQKIARQHDLELDNQILTVDVPVDPSQVIGEVQRLTDLFDRQPEVAISTVYEAKTITVRGFVLNRATQQTITQAFSQIPGVDRVIFNLLPELPNVSQHIYFDSGSSRVDAENITKIESVAEILQQHRQIHLKLMSHSDGIGAAAINQKLSQERCNNVRTALITSGIESSRLINSCNLPFFNKNKDRAAVLERYVSFEAFIPLNS